MPYPEIFDSSFRCALWLFKQQLTLKVWARCGISIVSYRRLCTVAFGICEVNVWFYTTTMANATEMSMNTGKLYNSSQEQNQDPHDYKTISIVIFTAEVVLVILGVIGNSLCFALTVKTNLRKMSSVVYLSVLAVCDNVILLWTNVVGSLMSYDLWFGKDVRNLHTVFCWGLLYVEFWFPQLSSWCLVAFTIERAVAVLFPHRHDLFHF